MSIFINPNSWVSLLEFDELERRINKLSPREQKQIRLKIKLKYRKGKYKPKLKLPE